MKTAFEFLQKDVCNEFDLEEQDYLFNDDELKLLKTSVYESHEEDVFDAYDKYDLVLYFSRQYKYRLFIKYYEDGTPYCCYKKFEKEHYFERLEKNNSYDDPKNITYGNYDTDDEDSY